MKRAFVVAALASLAVAGCGSVAAERPEGASTARGKELFAANCGRCHVLADAGTRGAVGPNLDEALDDVRAQGFEESTIRDMVRGQIAYPVSDPVTDAPGMPANLVTGEDAASVAAYVASVAGKPGAAGGAPAAAGGEAADGKAIFTQNCGVCHVLADAGTSGTTGPNLDEAQPSLEKAVTQVRNGGGGMPAFGDQLTDEQIQAVAEYVAESAGK